MTDTPGWLEGLVGSVRCASCGRLYRRDDLRLVGTRDDHSFVRCTCGACGSQGIAVVIVQTVVERIAPARRDVIAIDDVLAAHEVLRDYQGNVDGLFGARTP